MQVYLDNSSTTKQSAGVTAAMLEMMEKDFGNPSSLHRLGITVEKTIKKSREAAASAIGAAPDEVYFTSGGTESDNAAIFGACRLLKRRGNHVITTAIEHPAVLECFKRLEQDGVEVTRLGVDGDGLISLEELGQALRKDTILVSVMHVNNETGTVQPLTEIGRLIKEKAPEALFHCDAVQSYGKLPINVEASKIDLLAASGHKLHGPKGTGILYVRKGLHLPAYIVGGGQEKGQRSGTENTAGIVGFGKAAEEAASGNNMADHLKHVSELHLRLREGIESQIGDVKINSPFGGFASQAGMPYVLNVSFRGVRGEVVLHMLEDKGVFVSTGSACSSHKAGVNHVLNAIGLKPDEIEGTLRFSLSYTNTIEEIDYTLEVLKQAVESNRKMLKLAGKFRR